MQVADVDQELAIEVLTSDTREEQLSPGNCSVLVGQFCQYAFTDLLVGNKNILQFLLRISENSDNRDREGWISFSFF
jgi:hypothetical protein